jgi:hypothetical protein
MDHEVILRPYNICDWLLNSYHDHFGLHQGRNVRVTMKFEVPKRHILRPTLSTNMIRWVYIEVGEATKVLRVTKGKGPIAEKCRYNKQIMNCFCGKR